MSADINQESIELLKNNPEQVILSNQGMIKIIVSKYIKSRKFPYSEKDDVVQQINEELFKKIKVLQLQFQGRSLLKTYLCAVITNICNEIVRKNKWKRENHVSINEGVNSKLPGNVLDKVIIKEEVNRLKNTFDFYCKQKPKLLLFLKLRFRMPFNLDDFKNLHFNISEDDFEEFIQQIIPYEQNTDINIYTALTQIINKCENKNNTPDAIRKWIKQKINELIDIMNGDPPTCNYNEETFQILFEKYFHYEEEKFLEELNN